MPFTEFETARIEAAMSDFMAKRRPPVEIRDKLDLAYRIEGQSVVIFSIRPFWRDPGETIEEPAAKATYVRKADRWKIYWQRADLKWHAYPAAPGGGVIRRVSRDRRRGRELLLLGMMERAGMSEMDIYNRTRDVFLHYKLPYDAPPPEE